MRNKKVPSASISIIIAVNVLLFAVICISIVGAFRYFSNGIKKGGEAAQVAFEESYSETSSEVYDRFREYAYELSEAEHHVSNRVSISVSQVKEKAELEVLKVSDVVYIITDNSETKNGTVSWLKIHGNGVFTVNLAAAEILVDSVRQYVLIRVPSPELDEKNIDIDNYESIHFEENKWRRANSISAGENLARDQLSEAKQRIQEDFEASQDYSELAKQSSKSTLAALIKGFNPDVEDLEVDVEFYS